MSSFVPVRNAGSAVLLLTAGDREEQRVPAGMVRYDGDQSEDRALRFAGHRAGHRVPRHDRQRVTNIVAGGDPATELKKATAAFQPVLDKSNEG